MTRFLRGVFIARPTLPRYKEIWDVSIVFNYLKELHPVEQLTLKDVTHKTVILLALLSGQRCQTLHSLSIRNMLQTDEKIVFNIMELLKTSKPSKHWGRLEFIAYPEDKRLCVVTCLKHYLKLTGPLRGDFEQLLLSYQKPHKPVASETIGRWLKNVLNKAGIDTNIFCAHSTRSAATSAAKSLNISIQTIMDAAAWTNESTFQKFYCKPVKSPNFGEQLIVAINETKN